MRHIIGLKHDLDAFKKSNHIAIQSYPDMATKLNVGFMRYTACFDTKDEEFHPHHVYFRTNFDFYSTDKAYLKGFEEYLRGEYETEGDVISIGLVVSLNKKYQKGLIFQRFLPK
jgi:hypothetical protein